MSYQFEVAVDSLESALIAQDCGVDRIELCADLGSGGTTPSFGLLQVAVERLSIPIHVIIRPRRAISFTPRPNSSRCGATSTRRNRQA